MTLSAHSPVYDWLKLACAVEWKKDVYLDEFLCTWITAWPLILKLFVKCLFKGKMEICFQNAYCMPSYSYMICIRMHFTNRMNITIVYIHHCSANNSIMYGLAVKCCIMIGIPQIWYLMSDVSGRYSWLDQCISTEDGNRVINDAYVI